MSGPADPMERQAEDRKGRWRGVRVLLLMMSPMLAAMGCKAYATVTGLGDAWWALFASIGAMAYVGVMMVVFQVLATRREFRYATENAAKLDDMLRQYANGEIPPEREWALRQCHESAVSLTASLRGTAREVSQTSYVALAAVVGGTILILYQSGFDPHIWRQVGVLLLVVLMLGIAGRLVAFAMRRRIDSISPPALPFADADDPE